MPKIHTINFNLNDQPIISNGLCGIIVPIEIINNNNGEKMHINTPLSSIGEIINVRLT